MIFYAIAFLTLFLGAIVLFFGCFFHYNLSMSVLSFVYHILTEADK